MKPDRTKTAENRERSGGRTMAAMGWVMLGLVVLLAWGAGGWRAAADDGLEETVEQILLRARQAFEKGDHDEAIALADRAVQAAPERIQPYYTRGRFHEAMGEHRKAVADFDTFLSMDPNATGLYLRRGVLHFFLGNFDRSVSDFDEFLKRAPVQRPHLWQRGLALYYAGDFEEGRRQFERHQTVNSADVENAVWHFLCVARLEGVEAARAALIPIEGDPRVPMAEIFELFAGRGGVDEVLEAADRGGEGALRNQRCYAHLYLGLYFEALGEPAEARRHMELAAGRYSMAHYMGEVARVHLKARGWEAGEVGPVPAEAPQGVAPADPSPGEAP